MTSGSTEQLKLITLYEASGTSVEVVISAAETLGAGRRWRKLTSRPIP